MAEVSLEGLTKRFDRSEAVKSLDLRAAQNACQGHRAGGIALFPGQYTMPWEEISAACVIATLPLVILVLLFQRRIIRGLSAGSIVQ